MIVMTYSYNPSEIRKRGKDQMRFELGDTEVYGNAETSALADEEYTALLENVTPGNNAWRFAKLDALKAILMKLSYMVDTKIDVLQYGLGKRAELWQKLYEELRNEILINTGVPTMNRHAQGKPPYFHTDMKENYRAMYPAYPFRNMTE